MHDIKAIRENPQAFDAGMARRGRGPESPRLLELDETRRRLVTEIQGKQERRNAASKDIGKAMGAKDMALADSLKAEVATLKDEMAAIEAQERVVTAELDLLLASLPNLPLDEIPDGKDEHDNAQIRLTGEKPRINFKPKEHFEIGEALGMMDFEKATQISGARFVVLKGQLARLERALAQFMLDLHTDVHGYTEVSPPLLVRDNAMFGTAQLPKFEEDQFFAGSGEIRKSLLRQADEYDDPKMDKITLEMLRQTTGWLIPTAEVPLTNMVREEILDEKRLPMRMTAGTHCFRSEAGSAGRDTRGMIRQHQFFKVELVSITTPEQSMDEHERMTACAEAVLEKLGLHFRTVVLCT
ncbi:MAG: serine--tRNA ligase, partial [Rhizobiaceae bacterium]